jgi:hypothetical protein
MLIEIHDMFMTSKQFVVMTRTTASGRFPSLVTIDRQAAHAAMQSLRQHKSMTARGLLRYSHLSQKTLLDAAETAAQALGV